jgi:hypothetical protein
MWRPIIILANSRMGGNRCIAGIDIQTREWVRPCHGSGEVGIPWERRRVVEWAEFSQADAAGIPWEKRNVQCREPALLDVVLIPLDDDGPCRELQPENRHLLDGVWIKARKGTLGEVLPYLERDRFLLHNAARTIDPNALRALAPGDGKSLCLVLAYLQFCTSATTRGRKRVTASFTYNCETYALPVTDYEYERSFPAYSERKAICVLTISLGHPHTDGQCYKLVAGVLEISEHSRGQALTAN